MDLQHVSLYDLANFKNLKDLRKNHKSCTFSIFILCSYLFN